MNETQQDNLLLYIALRDLYLVCLRMDAEIQPGRATEEHYEQVMAYAAAVLRIEQQADK